MIRFSKNASSAGVNRCASFTESAVAALPIRGASAAEGRPKGRTTGVFLDTLDVFSAGFALFFTVGTRGNAKIVESDVLLAVAPPRALPTSSIP